MSIPLLPVLKSFSKKELLVFLAASLLALVSGIVLLVQIIHNNTVRNPANGGSYSEGIAGQISFVNPVLARDGTANKDVASLIFADMLTLAESVKSSDGFKKWTLRIKENAKWEDDSPLTSDDVIFTVQLIQNPETGSPLSASWQNVSVQRISERELEFRLSSPYGAFENLLKDLRPIPKKLFADVSPANIKFSEYNLKPLGSGPYKYDSYESRRDGFITSYTLVRNDAFANIGDAPHIDVMELKFYENEENLIKGFNLGSVDAFGTSDPTIEDKLDINAKVHDVPTYKYYALFLNQTANPLLRSHVVRKAIQSAISKQEINNDILYGHGLEMKGPLPPIVGIESESNILSSPDTILSQDGWSRNANNTWEKQGTSLAFTITVPDVEILKRMAENLTTQLKRNGIEATLAIADPQKVQEEAISTRNYEALLFGNILFENPDLFHLWHSSEKYAPGSNLALYENTNVDRLIEALQTTGVGSEERNARLQVISDTIESDSPAIFLVSPSYVYVTRNNIPDFSLGAISLSHDRFTNIEKWYVKTNISFK